MADDDDTSAGLTLDGKKRPSRRRASRSAGPANGAIPSKPVDETRVPGIDEGAEVAATSDTESSAEESSQEEAPAKEPSAKDGETAPTTAEPAAVEQPEAEGDSGDHEATPTAGSAQRGRLFAAIAAGVTLVVALVGAGSWLFVQQNNAIEAAVERNVVDERRNAVMEVARETVLNLTTIKPETVEQDVERILAGASGAFEAEFDGRVDPFVSVVKEAGVTTVGTILETGIESEDGNTTKVLVAARADVSTPNGTEGGPRDFRMRVTVTDDGGVMTASQVEFVP
ncbi:hypothetical protein [Rhodococcus spongiicola]|uniref:hypothetical protein n=1 Tax=Rhodococcus spongiicola TaxID=2487352 RepID=UPI001F1917D6|nr:hypothetical protein [Rhodococcus spongiicola]